PLRILDFLIEYTRQVLALVGVDTAGEQVGLCSGADVYGPTDLVVAERARIVGFFCQGHVAEHAGEALPLGEGVDGGPGVAVGRLAPAPAVRIAVLIESDVVGEIPLRDVRLSGIDGLVVAGGGQPQPGCAVGADVAGAAGCVWIVGPAA